jgi:hypothetical protein
MKIVNIHRGVAEIENDLIHRRPDWKQRMAEWETAVRSNQPAWQVVWPLVHVGDHNQHYHELKDQSLLADGYAPTKMNETFRNTNTLSGITAFRLELLTDPDLPFYGPGRSFMGTCALTEFNVEVQEVTNPTNKVKIKWASATTDYDQPEHPLEPNFYDKSTNSRVTGPLKHAMDGNDHTAWGIDAGPGRRNTDRKAVFQAKEPAGFTNGTILTFYLKQHGAGTATTT